VLFRSFRGSDREPAGPVAKGHLLLRVAIPMILFDKSSETRPRQSSLVGSRRHRGVGQWKAILNFCAVARSRNVKRLRGPLTQKFAASISRWPSATSQSRTISDGHLARSSDLGDWRAQRAFAVRLLHLVRTEKRELAAALLLAEAAKLRPGLAIPDAPGVAIGGRDLLVAGLLAAADDLAAKGARLAVTALDLVNRRYFGSKDGKFPQRDSIWIEARFYGEPPDQRARDCPRRTLSRAGHEQYLWRRLGIGPVTLTLKGVQDLAAFQRELGPPVVGSAPDREKAIFLAGWLMWLRVEAAVEWEIVRHGLPYPMPVIFGVDQLDRPMESNEWDYGPRAETLHFASGEPGRLSDAKTIGR